MNACQFIGRIGRNGEAREVGAGKMLGRWTMAIDSGYGERKQTIWLDCTMFGDRGAKLAEMINKGDRIGVSGELGIREHEGKTYITLNVRDVTLLTPKDQRQESAPRQQAQRPQREQPASGGGSIQDDSDIPFSPLSKRTHW